MPTALPSYHVCVMSLHYYVHLGWFLGFDLILCSAKVHLWQYKHPKYCSVFRLYLACEDVCHVLSYSISVSY